MINAGRTASKAEAIKLTPARNRIIYRISGLSFKYTSPSLARLRTLPSFTSFSGTSGMVIKQASAINATAKDISASSPASP